jgi:hypothetical protein
MSELIYKKESYEIISTRLNVYETMDCGFLGVLSAFARKHSFYEFINLAYFAHNL